ncbi:MAG TPA: TraB/GumN family protein [Pyrinomonadaceae bacterium]
MNKFLILILAAMLLPAAIFAQAEPEIMSYREYGKIKHKRPYILKFRKGSGELLYFGIGHAYKADDPQIAELERQFLEFRPTLVLNESGTPPALETAQAAIERYGEPGLMSFLAKKHNIPIKSLDAPRLEEIRYILSTKRWTLEQVMLFYILRRVPENNKKVNPQSPDAMVEEMLKATAKMPGFEAVPKNLAEFEASVKKHLPTVADWRKVDSKIFDPNPDLGLYTNDVADASVNFRGKYMVKLLTAEVEKGERVFAVVGASHVVKQEKALRKLLQ